MLEIFVTARDDLAFDEFLFRRLKILVDILDLTANPALVDSFKVQNASFVVGLVEIDRLIETHVRGSTLGTDHSLLLFMVRD